MIFRKGTLNDLIKILEIKESALKAYKDSGLNWNKSYPNEEIFKNDINRNELYILEENQDIIGIVVLNNNEDINYKNINWIKSEKYLVIHRLLVNPKYSRKGYGKALLRKIEEYGIKNKFTSIKLDTNTENIGAQALYSSMDYIFLGKISLEGKNGEFYAIQKILK